MRTPEESQIRNVIASPVGKTNFGWVCQPADYVTPDQICGGRVQEASVEPL